MKISEILIEAKKKIYTPEKWTASTLARDSKNQEVDFDSKNAVCFCSIGALKVEFHEKNIPNSTWYSCIKALSGTMDVGAALFNDVHTHEEVMAAWDKAIAATQAHGD